MSVADNYQAFSFTPRGQQTLLLAGVLEASDDDLEQRLASFAYLKRDGGEIEPMGAAQARFSFRLTLMGSAPLTPGGPPLTAGQRYQTLASTQRSQPRGLLVHPRLGRWNVGWAKIRAHEQPQRAVDTIELTVDFLEDQTDAAVAIEAQPTPQGRASEVVSAYSVLKAAVALRFGDSHNPLMRAVTAATDALAAAAEGFAVAATEAAQVSTPDPSLRQQLGAVEAATEVLLAALTATLPYTLESDTSLTPYRHQAYMTLAGSYNLMDALAEQRPVLVDYVVPAAMSLDAVLLSLYGSDAAGHLDEILSLNRIQSPLWLPQGSTLRVVSPQVRQ